MCSTPLACVGASDYCCVEKEEDCGSDGPRTCSLLLNPVLPEWYGVSWRDHDAKTPEELAELYPEKYGPQAELSQIKKQEKPGQAIKPDSNLTMYVVLGAGSVAVLLLLFIMIRICAITNSEVSKTQGIFEKALANATHGEPEAQYHPSHTDEDAKKKSRKQKWQGYQVRVAPAGMPELPVSNKMGQKTSDKRETAVFQQLRRLTLGIKKRGSISGAAEQKELSEAVARAENQANAKMGPDDAGNLIAQGKQQLALLEKEQSLTAITKATDVDVMELGTDYQPARPGGTTVADQDRYRAL